jgi:hypothetical protein
MTRMGTSRIGLSPPRHAMGPLGITNKAHAPLYERADDEGGA